MRRWTVMFNGGSADLIVAADRMTISDGGALVFWVGHDGQFADTVSLAIASGQWFRVEAQS